MIGRISDPPNGVLGVTLSAMLLVANASPVLAADPPSAEPRGFSARAEKAQVRIGELFAYSIEVRHDPAESYELAGALMLDPFEATGPRCRRDPKLQGKDAVTRCTMRLALFDLGDHDIPEITLSARTPSGERILRVPGARVTGVSMLDPSARSEDLQLRDIAPPVPLMVPSTRLLLWAAGALGAIGLLIAGTLFLRRLRRRAEAPIPTLPPHQRFEQMLDALEVEALPRHGRGREYFFRLSEAIREYVGTLYQLNALDLTTEEILAAFAGRELGRLDREKLAFFCRHADLVKFARQEPAESECGEAMAFARDLLERTRPLPESQVGAPPSADPKAA